jgi:Ca-activated chloride channel homolog
MDLIWPASLLLLGLIPLLTAVYILSLRRRRRNALRYSSLVLVRQALPRQSRLRRHLPFAVFMLALTSLVIALGRPVSIVSVPSGGSTIILAMDVSRSMCATDIHPNRLEAAKSAAKSFVQRQTAKHQIGIVAFAGFAELVQRPTTDQELLQDAVDNLVTGRRTAIGSAILASLEAIDELNESSIPGENGLLSPGLIRSSPEGVFAPDIIVLLTDGSNNSGPFPLDAAQHAVDRGIRIYTVGFGTEDGGVMDCGDQFQSSFQFGGGFHRAIDEPTLIQIAEMTGGEYYPAMSAGDLQEVFRSLPIALITREEITEISVAFAALGALLSAIAIFLSWIWHPHP